MDSKQQFEEHVREMEKLGCPFVGFYHNGWHNSGWFISRTDELGNIWRLPDYNAVGSSIHKVTLSMHMNRYQKLRDKTKRKAWDFCEVTNAGNGARTLWLDRDGNEITEGTNRRNVNAVEL